MKKKTWIIKMWISEESEDDEEFYLDGSGTSPPEEFVKYHTAAGIEELGCDVDKIEIISVKEQKISN